MGRKPIQGGIHRMSFSFSTKTAIQIIKASGGRPGGYTHFVAMAVHQYIRMRAFGAWTCYRMESPENYTPACGHLNSFTADSCEKCGGPSPEVLRLEKKARDDKWAEERGTAVPIVVDK